MKQHVPPPVVTASFEGVLTAEDTLDLVSEPWYDTNVVSRHHLSDEQEQALIERARSGDQVARDELLLSLLPPVKRFAARYFLTYSWRVAGGVSPDDLVSEASLRMLERFSAALAASNPCAYLLTTAYGAIRHAMWQQASPIRTPDTPGVKPKVVMSLHAPLDADSDTTLLDVLPADDLLPSAPHEECDYTPVYQAALSLSETERAVLAAWYGLYEIAPASLETILTQLGRTGMDGYKSHILARLYRRLAPIYPQYCQEVYVQELRTPGMHAQVPLSEQKIQRLDAAYAHLQQSGQKITVRRLSRAAGVHSTAASRYLHQQGYARSERKQRLDAAYAHLQQSGQSITGRLLAQRAHVESDVALLYLHQRRCHESPSYRPRFGAGPNQPDGAARLAHAYAQVQHSGQHLSITTLAKAAHVRWGAAASYLRQMGAQQGGGDAA